MDCESKKKNARITDEDQDGEDRISRLSDDLLHIIMSFIHIKLAVQTCILSKRWKFVWTTLPSLKFNDCPDFNFIDKFFSHRNHDYDISDLALTVDAQVLPCSSQKLISYAVQHNVQELEFIHFNSVNLSAFSSTSMKTLILFFADIVDLDCCWDLPALTTLFVLQSPNMVLPESHLSCLSSLEKLMLFGIDLPDSVSLPCLKTLFLQGCYLPEKAWDVPALETLTLQHLEFPQENTSGFLRGLVNLVNLILDFETSIVGDWVIDCPQLENLVIDDCLTTDATHLGKILVTSQKLRNFGSYGFFPITFKVLELESVIISLRHENPAYIIYKTNKITKRYIRRFTNMFPRFYRARVLTLDSGTIEALSSILNLLVHSRPPFCNLEYVRVPDRYKESGLPPKLIRYLLANSPKATILTALSQSIISHTAAASVTDQNVVQQEPLAAPTKVWTDSVHETACVDTVWNSIVNAESSSQ